MCFMYAPPNRHCRQNRWVPRHHRLLWCGCNWLHYHATWWWRWGTNGHQVLCRLLRSLPIRELVTTIRGVVKLGTYVVVVLVHCAPGRLFRPEASVVAPPVAVS